MLLSYNLKYSSSMRWADYNNMMTDSDPSLYQQMRGNARKVQNCIH